MTTEEAAGRYCRWFESLSVESLVSLEDYFHESARFKDPFNDVTGLAAIHRVFAHMFEQVYQPSFIISDQICANDCACIRWRFSYSSRKGSARREVEGVSRVQFGVDGKALEHIDYWDPVEGIYRHLPVLGPAFRWLTRKISSS